MKRLKLFFVLIFSFLLIRCEATTRNIMKELMVERPITYPLSKKETPIYFGKQISNQTCSNPQIIKSKIQIISDHYFEKNANETNVENDIKYLNDLSATLEKLEYNNYSYNISRLGIHFKRISVGFLQYVGWNSQEKNLQLEINSCKK